MGCKKDKKIQNLEVSQFQQEKRRCTSLALREAPKYHPSATESSYGISQTRSRGFFRFFQNHSSLLSFHEKCTRSLHDRPENISKIEPGLSSHFCRLWNPQCRAVVVVVVKLLAHAFFSSFCSHRNLLYRSLRRVCLSHCIQWFLPRQRSAVRVVEKESGIKLSS